MRERMTARYLASFGDCCLIRCENCPFIPMWGPSTDVDREFLIFSDTNPEVIRQEYEEKKTRPDPIDPTTL